MTLAASPCVNDAQYALSQGNWPAAQSYASDSKSVSSFADAAASQVGGAPKGFSLQDSAS
jgi:hypothetical protein